MTTRTDPKYNFTFSAVHNPTERQDDRIKVLFEITSENDYLILHDFSILRQNSIGWLKEGEVAAKADCVWFNITKVQFNVMAQFAEDGQPRTRGRYYALRQLIMDVHDAYPN